MLPKILAFLEYRLCLSFISRNGLSDLVVTRCWYQGKGNVDPQVNKFEHVSGDGRQMSLAGGQDWSQDMQGPMSDVRGGAGPLESNA